jgi:hypothetical protein
MAVSTLLVRREELLAAAREALRRNDLTTALAASRDAEALQAQIEHLLRFPAPVRIAPAGNYRPAQPPAPAPKTRKARQSVAAKPPKEKAPPKLRTPKALKVVAAPPGPTREKDVFTSEELDQLFHEMAAV